MEITEVRIKLMDDPQERLQAFCSITFDACFVIRDLKIIEGAKGSFVAMPSRKLTDRCPQCNSKNHLRSLFCNQCGARLQEDRACKDDDGRAKLYADIAHPINSRCRELIQTEVLKAFELELVKAQQPGYICSYDDYGEERYATLSEVEYGAFELPETSEAAASGSDRRHRLDRPERISTPHHHVSEESERVSSTNSNHSSNGSDDGFGAGIL